MDLTPMEHTRKKPLPLQLIEKCYSYILSNWVFEKPLEKLILIVMLGYAVWSFIRWLFL